MNQQMTKIVKGGFSARISRAAADISTVQHFRASQFGGAVGPKGLDCDQFDDACRHVLVEEITTGALVACFRFLHLASGAEIEKSYAAQFYDLSNMKTYKEPVLEVGRFCIDPASTDPDILRIAWAVLTRFVDAYQIGLMFGCSSFHGTAMRDYIDAFALLRQSHLAPAQWAPQVKSANLIRYAEQLAKLKPDVVRANKTMPPLLRTYLTMGGWVSDHAVIDRQLNTLHVFTGVEIAAIPPMRKRLLRADAA